MKTAWRCILTGILLVSSLFGQGYLDVLRPFYGMQGLTGTLVPGDLAGIADANALTLNPAALTNITTASTGVELSMNVAQGTAYVDSIIWNEARKRRTSVHGFHAIYPVPVYRGSWVWAVSLMPRTFFDGIREFDAFDPIDSLFYEMKTVESGALYSLSLGTAVLYSRTLSLGVSTAYLFGENEYVDVNRDFDDLDIYQYARWVDSTRIEPHYSGWDIRLGLLKELSPTLKLGLSLAIPSFIRVTERSTLDTLEIRDPGWGDDIAGQEATHLNYQLWGPWHIGVGLTYDIAALQVFAAYRYHTYGSMAFDGEIYEWVGTDSVNIENRINWEMEHYLQNSSEIQAGLRVRMNRFELGTGFALLPQPLVNSLQRPVRFDTRLSFAPGESWWITLGLHYRYLLTDMDHAIGFSQTTPVTRLIDLEEELTKVVIGVNIRL